MFDDTSFRGRLFDARKHLEGLLREDVTYAALAARVTAAHDRRQFKGPQIWEYEQGKVTPPLEVIVAYAKACGVDPGWLAFGKDSKAPAPNLGDAANPSVADEIPVRLPQPFDYVREEGAENRAETAPHVTHRKVAGQRGKGRR